MLNYKYRRKITIDHTKIDSDLTHFPLPIVLNSSAGLSGNDVTDIFDEVGNDYNKIAVTLDDGGTQLYVEVEQWDSVNEKALLWVSKSDFTVLYASDTELYFYYDANADDNTDYVGLPGSRTEVWNSNFAAVYTMAQDPSGGAGCIKDSTSNANHGTPGGSMTSDDLVNGQIGNAIEFDGGDDYIEIPHDNSIVLGDGDFEISWVEHPYNINSNDNVRIEKGGVSGTGSFYIYDNLSYRIRIDGDDWSNSSVDINTRTWNYCYLTRDAGDVHFHINSVLEEDKAATVDLNSTSNMYIASAGGISRYFDGMLSHIRLAKTTRSTSWIKADYHAQTDNLLTWSAEEKLYTLTYNPFNITLTTASLSGKLDVLLEPETDVWFEYGSDYPSGNITDTQTLSAIGSFTEEISGLNPYSTYYYRTASLSGFDTYYGNIIEFQTSIRQVAGKVVKDSIEIENAKIKVHNSTKSTFVGETTSDADGNFNLNIESQHTSGDLYHVFIEYQDELGKYYTYSYPFLDPERL